MNTITGWADRPLRDLEQDGHTRMCSQAVRNDCMRHPVKFRCYKECREVRLTLIAEEVQP